MTEGANCRSYAVLERDEARLRTALAEAESKLAAVTAERDDAVERAMSYGGSAAGAHLLCDDMRAERDAAIARAEAAEASDVSFRVEVNELLPREFGVTARGAIVALRKRAEAAEREAASLRAMLPTDEERATIALALRCVDPTSDAAGCMLVSERLQDMRAFLARLDAARERGGTGRVK